MRNFSYRNPTRIVFGRDTISSLGDLISRDSRILITYGGGSIKRNGVYDKILSALEGYEIFEFGGIEPNPDYDTLLRAVELAQKEKISFLLSAGGGSVLDGTKFIAAATCFSGDPWEIIRSRGKKVEDAISIGSVLTLPAAGSESNPNAVISRRSMGVKLHFGSEKVHPVFAVLDPQTTFSLPASQLRNGIVDAYVHVMEQYATFPAKAPLQERQSEAILSVLTEYADAILSEPPDYDARAVLMWCSNQALNGLVGLGMPQDWSTHMIGHELTALYGLDHGVSLALVLPGVLRHRIEFKRTMLEQYGRRVFNASSAEDAIDRTLAFFRQIGMSTRWSELGIDSGEAASKISSVFRERKIRLGEHSDIGPDEVHEILSSCILP